MKSPVFSPNGPSFSSHDDALEQALKLYLATVQPYLRHQALETLSRHLVHPRQILRTSLLTESHPLKKEALLISDAFEAVTNGMHQNGVMEALDTLAPDSLFLPWKHLILALYFFYEDLEEGCLAHLSQIPDHSPLARFKGLFHALFRPLAGFAQYRNHNAVMRLVETLFQSDPFLTEAIQQMGDALDTQMEDQYFLALEDAVQIDFREDGARSLVLWAWNQMAWQNFDEYRLIELSEKLFGQAEAYRLAALGSFGYDPEGALLFWGRFLLESSREDSFELVEAHEAWKLFFEFIAAVADFQEDQGPVDGWDKDWQSFAQVWQREVTDNLNPSWVLPATWAGVKNLAQQKLFGIPEVQRKPEVPPSAPKTPESRPGRSKTDGQLDLFA